jgi:hypothetical protein
MILSVKLSTPIVNVPPGSLDEVVRLTLDEVHLSTLVKQLQRSNEAIAEMFF